MLSILFKSPTVGRFNNRAGYRILPPVGYPRYFDTRHICPLDSAIGKQFNTYFWSSPTTRPKRQPFLQMGLQEMGYLDLGYGSPGTQNGSSYK
jgi:hypothetical protein